MPSTPEAEKAFSNKKPMYYFGNFQLRDDAKHFFT